MKDLKIEDVEKIVREAFIKNPPKQDIMMAQHCLDKGWVNRGCMDLQLCKNPKCTACRSFEKDFNESMKQEAKKYEG